MGTTAAADQRNTAAQRGYGAKWQRERLRFLEQHPLCIDHQARGKVVAATVVDHKIPHKGDLKLFWSRSNWQPLCKPCHDSHKQRLETTGKAPGCDIHGLPLESTHHWHAMKGRGG